MEDRHPGFLVAPNEFDVFAAWIRKAHERLRHTVLELSDNKYEDSSLLPEWTARHVLTHLARNSDAVRNLLLSARSGRPVSIYPTRELRAEDIRVGAGRTSAAIRSDVLASMERFEIDIEAMPKRCWTRLVPYQSRFGPEGTFPIVQFLLMRLFEIEAHHVDLRAGYTFWDTPIEIRERFLDLAAAALGSRCKPFIINSTDTDQRIAIGNSDGTPEIVGESDALLAWLSGRDSGQGLQPSRGLKLPWLPPLA